MDNVVYIKPMPEPQYGVIMQEPQNNSHVFETVGAIVGTLCGVNYGVALGIGASFAVSLSLTPVVGIPSGLLVGAGCIYAGYAVGDTIGYHLDYAIFGQTTPYQIVELPY